MSLHKLLVEKFGNFRLVERQEYDYIDIRFSRKNGTFGIAAELGLENVEEYGLMPGSFVPEAFKDKEKPADYLVLYYRLRK